MSASPFAALAAAQPPAAAAETRGRRSAEEPRPALYGGGAHCAQLSPSSSMRARGGGAARPPSRLAATLDALARGPLLVTRPPRPTPLGLPLVADRLGTTLSTEGVLARLEAILSGGGAR